MKAMILAAGLGKRLRPLTDKIPKPLVTVNNIPLLQYHIQKLVDAGVTEIVINHAWLGEQIERFVAENQYPGCKISCSAESEPLETAGGILKALPLLSPNNFIVVNGDIWSEYDYAKLTQVDLQQDLAHLVLVRNPEHNPSGDFYFSDGRVLATANKHSQKYTFAGISILSPLLFEGLTPGKLALKPLLDKAISQGRVSACLMQDYWCDVGTLERLESLRAFVLRREVADSVEEDSNMIGESGDANEKS